MRLVFVFLAIAFINLPTLADDQTNSENESFHLEDVRKDFEPSPTTYPSPDLGDETQADPVRVFDRTEALKQLSQVWNPRRFHREILLSLVLDSSGNVKQAALNTSDQTKDLKELINAARKLKLPNCPTTVLVLPINAKSIKCMRGWCLKNKSN